LAFFEGSPPSVSCFLLGGILSQLLKKKIEGKKKDIPIEHKRLIKGWSKVGGNYMAGISFASRLLDFHDFRTKLLHRQHNGSVSTPQEGSVFHLNSRKDDGFS